MEDMRSIREFFRRMDFIHGGESFGVLGSDLYPAGVESVQFAQLMNAQSSLYIHHVVLVPQLRDLIIPRPRAAISVPGVVVHSMKDQRAHARGELTIAGRYHAAFSGGQVLGRVKAKGNRASVGADFPAGIVSAHRVRSVFYYINAVRFR